MRVDPEYLRRQYASLSDEALLAVNRAELVEVAQQCYDAEIARRGLDPQRKVKPAAKKKRAEVEPFQDVTEDGGAQTHIPLGDGERPSWIADASEVFSANTKPDPLPAADIADVREVLEAASIPCYIESLSEVEDAVPARTVERVRVLVPGQSNLRASNVLDRDIFNKDFELEWKAHLEQLADDELRAMRPEEVFSGLYDRIERIQRAYNTEASRRGMDIQPE